MYQRQPVDLDPLGSGRFRAWIDGIHKENHEQNMRTLKADAGIVLALAGWHAYQRTKVQRKGKGQAR
jgi:hypothetical protein